MLGWTPLEPWAVPVTWMLTASMMAKTVDLLSAVNELFSNLSPGNNGFVDYWLVCRRRNDIDQDGP